PNCFGRDFPNPLAKTPAARAKIDNCQTDDERAPWKKFLEQVRNVEKERLRAMDVCSDFAEARQKFADDHQFVKTRDPKPSGDDPNQKDRQRREPWPPTAPCGCPFHFSETQLISEDPGKQKLIDDRAFDQHSRGQQTKHHESISAIPRLLLPDFFPDQKSAQKNDERERHVGAHQRRESRTQGIESERRERDEPGDVSA